jgi:uncharacterized membrane protein
MKFIRRHKYNLFMAANVVTLVIVLINVNVAYAIFAFYICVAIYFAMTSKWSITYVKGRRPPVHIQIDRRKKE